MLQILPAGDWWGVKIRLVGGDRLPRVSGAVSLFMKVALRSHWLTYAVIGAVIINIELQRGHLIIMDDYIGKIKCKNL